MRAPPRAAGRSGPLTRPRPSSERSPSPTLESGPTRWRCRLSRAGVARVGPRRARSRPASCRRPTASPNPGAGRAPRPVKRPRSGTRADRTPRPFTPAPRRSRGTRLSPLPRDRDECHRDVIERDAPRSGPCGSAEVLDRRVGSLTRAVPRPRGTGARPASATEHADPLFLSVSSVRRSDGCRPHHALRTVGARCVGSGGMQPSVSAATGPAPTLDVRGDARIPVATASARRPPRSAGRRNGSPVRAAPRQGALGTERCDRSAAGDGSSGLLPPRHPTKGSAAAARHGLRAARFARTRGAALRDRGPAGRSRGASPGAPAELVSGAEAGGKRAPMPSPRRSAVTLPPTPADTLPEGQIAAGGRRTGWRSGAGLSGP